MALWSCNKLWPIFTHIGPKADTTVSRKKLKKERHPKRRSLSGLVEWMYQRSPDWDQTVDTGERVSVKVLLDSGATECFIDKNLQKKNVSTWRRCVTQPRSFNVDEQKSKWHDQSHCWLYWYSSKAIQNTLDSSYVDRENTDHSWETWLKIHNPR